MENEIQRMLGAEVRRRRELLGWTQAALGYAIGISKVTIGKIEKGDKKCTAFEFLSLARVFGCSCEELVGEPVLVEIGQHVRGGNA